MNLDNIVLYDDVYADEESGVTFTKKQVEREITRKAHLMFKEEYLQTLVRLGLNNEVGLHRVPTKESNLEPVKAGFRFQMTHEVAMRRLIEENILNDGEKLFLFCTLPYLKFPNNTIEVHGRYLTLKELGKIIGRGETSMGTIVKGLEQKEIITVVRAAKLPPVIYLNPYLFASGRRISTDTVDMFRESRFSPQKYLK